jgi:hypothetical protein
VSASEPKSSAWLFARPATVTPAAVSERTAFGGARKKNGLPGIASVRLPRSATQH